MVGCVVLEGGFAPSPPTPLPRWGRGGPGFQFSVASEVGLGVEWAFWLTRSREDAKPRIGMQGVWGHEHEHEHEHE